MNEVKLIHLLEESQKCQAIISKILPTRVEEVEVICTISVTTFLIRNE